MRKLYLVSYDIRDPRRLQRVHHFMKQRAVALQYSVFVFEGTEADRRAVREGLAPFLDQFEREVTDEDIEALLRIPIRRISLYDIRRVQKEQEELRARLARIEADLDDILPYTVDFLQRLIGKYRDRFPRRTEIVSFEKTDVREAARRDLKLRYDRKSGYLGYEVATGGPLFEVSAYDRILVIRKDGTYSVIDAPDRLFVGKGMLHCGLVDKAQVFNVVYRDENGSTYIKRCRIDKFVLNRSYALVPEKARILKLTTDSERRITLAYKPRPRLRVLEEEFPISRYPVRGLKAKGIRLSTKELKSCRIV